MLPAQLPDRGASLVRRKVRVVRFRSVVAAGAAALALVLLLPNPSHAEPYKSQSKCKASPMRYDTNDWSFFLGHKIRVNAGQCHNGTFVKYAKQPTVSFPSRGPQGATEDVKLTAKPHIISVQRFETGAIKIVWQFSVSQKVFKIPFSNNFDITYTTWPAANQLCVRGGKCDKQEHDW